MRCSPAKDPTLPLRIRAPMGELGKTLILIGTLLVVGGLLLTFSDKLPFGRLPGDITVRRDGLTLYLPLGTSLLLSLLLSLILTLAFSVLRR